MWVRCQTAAGLDAVVMSHKGEVIEIDVVAVVEVGAIRVGGAVAGVEPLGGEEPGVVEVNGAVEVEVAERGAECIEEDAGDAISALAVGTGGSVEGEAVPRIGID